jgi:hypothetical protein
MDDGRDQSDGELPARFATRLTPAERYLEASVLSHDEETWDGDVAFIGETSRSTSASGRASGDLTNLSHLNEPAGEHTWFLPSTRETCLISLIP